jgi:hypothetical protein
LFWAPPEKQGGPGVLFWAPPEKPGRAGVLFWAPPEKPGRAGFLFLASPRARAGPGARKSLGPVGGPEALVCCLDELAILEYHGASYLWRRRNCVVTALALNRSAHRRS